MKSKAYAAMMAAALFGGIASAQGFLQVKTEANESPVSIEQMAVNASVKGLYATVDYEFVFHNPNSRVMEGELELPLPDSAAVCGYAIDVNGVMVDGVIVNKEKARVVFETEARRGVDPGIVEQVRGNLYKTRIYPLPARGKRTVRVSYTTPLTVAQNGDAALRLTMPKVKLGSRKITIEVDTGSEAVPELGGLGDSRFEKAELFWRVSAEETGVEPSEDVLVSLPKLPAELSGVEKDREGDVWFYVSTIAPQLVQKATPPPAAIDIIWDASGSRAGPERKLDLAVIKALPPSAKYRVVVFRNKPEAAVSFDSSAEVVEYLESVPFDGGTDFAALSAALDGNSVLRLLFTDGIDTLSDKPLEFEGAKPVAVVSSTVADHEGLRQACGGAIVDLQTTPIDSAIGEILSPSPRVSGIVGTGVADVQSIGRVAYGRVTLTGRLTAPSAEIKIAFDDVAESAPFHLKAAGAREGTTLRKAWAVQRVAQMAPRADDFADELLEIGRKYGVVSPATSLIVLESLDQWVRYGIEPPETLPEMREQWRNALKTRNSEIESSESGHLARLEELWKERVAWLKRDFKKKPYKENGSSGAGGGGIMPIRLFSNRSVPPVVDASVASEDSGGPTPTTTAALPGEEGALESPASAEPAYGFHPLEADVSDVSEEEIAGVGGSRAVSKVEIKAWNPKTPYMDALKKVETGGLLAEYLKQRAEFGSSPAFYLDCADYCYAVGQGEVGTRILTNLAELKIDDSSLLRVFAWRLRQAGQYELAAVQLRRVIKLRGEDPQSYRDLALTLDEWGRAERDPAKVEEAMELYIKVAFTPWSRHADALGLLALEELNALINWIEAVEYDAGRKPKIPEFDSKFREKLSTDLRIVMAWDADNTDIDLHVVEPGGEEAFYGHNRTKRGGIVSKDITDGYGPEEYMVSTAPQGEYEVFVNYFASHQQTLLGPATVTATVFTDWGRQKEKRQTLSVRLDTPKDKVPLGRVLFGGDGGDGTVIPLLSLKDISVGMTIADAEAILGKPKKTIGAEREYDAGGSLIKVTYGEDGKLIRAERHFPGGVVMILAQ